MTDVAMVFGTDDHDAVQACVTAAARGGHCTFPAGQSFVISSAGQNVTVPPGATIDGSGTIYYAPQGTITAMINDTLFGVNEEGGTNISYPYRIAAPPEISTRPSDIVTGCTQSSKARSPSSGPRRYKMRPGFLVLGIVDAAAAAMGA